MAQDASSGAGRGPDRAGRKRLVTAVVAGVALVGVLVGIQLVDEGDGPARHTAEQVTLRHE